MITSLVIGAVVAVVLLYIIAVYNRFVALRNRVENAFAQIEVQLVRRLDLIPNLVSTAKAYMSHERETLIAVTEARDAMADALKALSANPGSAQAAQGLISADATLKNAMGQFSVKVEAYPDLHASSNMSQLSEALSTTENQVSFARQAYNDAVMAYNTYKQGAPQVFFAGMFGHGGDAVALNFDDRPERHAAPTVSF